MQNANLSKLKYRIVYCSGEEPDYPVTELLNQTQNTKGWHSPKYCEYPCEIAIQFVSGVRVRQIQFLSHHCKISTKVEIYVYAPDKNIPPNHREIKYKKLGYLSLDSNEKSGFQARELKSVYIDTPCMYMKFVLQKCYVNKFNIFNQVGLVALSVFGEPLDAPPGYAQQKPKEYYNEIQFETQFDAGTLERLRALEEAKEKSVQREDFMEAKRIKEAIERLKQIGVQLRQLEERKSVAIQNEDYDSAAIIKQEIEKIRNAVAPETLFRNQPQQYQQQQYQPQPQQYQQQPQQQPYPQDDAYYQQQSRQNGNPPLDLFNQPQGEEIMSHSRFEEQKADPASQRNRRVVKDQAYNHEDQVVPAALKQQKPNQFEDEQQRPQNFNLEELEGENKMKAEFLSPILTERFCQMMFSKQWPAREDGLKWLETQINRPNEVNAQDPAMLFVSCMAAIHYTIQDKVTAVQQRALSVLQALLAKHSKLKIGKKAELSEYIDSTTQGVMEKLGDGNSRVKEQAEAAIMMMCDHPSIGALVVGQHLIKGFTGKPKLDSSIKHIVARLQALTEMVKRYEINNANMPYQPIIDYAIKMLDDKNESVRTQAICLLGEVYKFVGARLRQSLGNVRQAQLDALEAFFNQIDGGGEYQAPIEQQPQQQTKVSTNMDVQGAKNAKPPQKKATKETPQQQQQQQQQNTAKCDYCDKIDPGFRDQDKLDYHMWSQCPMLVACSLCSFVVEVADLTNHLLNECDQKRKFKQCPRCKEANITSEFDKYGN